MNHDGDLLQPSLGNTSTTATAIYSASTGYVAAFLGGPVGGAVIALLNARRLNRLSRDWPIALLAVAIMATLLWWEYRMAGNAWLVAHLGQSGPRLLLRVTGIAFFAGIYALHLKSYRSMALLGIDAPSGWVPGIAAVVIGVLIQILLTNLVQP